MTEIFFFGFAVGAEAGEPVMSGVVAFEFREDRFGAVDHAKREAARR